MTSLMRFIALHDTSIGLVGTAIIVLAVIVGYGRRHNVASFQGGLGRTNNGVGSIDRVGREAETPKHD